MRIRSRDAEVPTSGDPQLRARAEAAERGLALSRDRLVRAEHQCQQLRQELSSRDDQLEALREDWEDVTQRVSRVLVDYLDRKHDAH
jgi:chromosome segregation ATPase